MDSERYEILSMSSQELWCLLRDAYKQGWEDHGEVKVNHELMNEAAYAIENVWKLDKKAP